MRLTCPHCQQNTLRIRSSQQQLSTLRRIWVQCINVHCGFTGAGHTEITHQINAPAVLNTAIRLKQQGGHQKSVAMLPTEQVNHNIV